MTAISQAIRTDYEDIKSFYHQCGYGGGLNEKDLILIARLEAKIIGAVRLCPERDFCVLRGMQVLAPFQRQGIGKQLLLSCTECLVDRVCYCIPWQHLSALYQQAGFQEIYPREAPVMLRERYNNYISREMSIIVMCRLPNL
jgi:N-acetylglutamate synthase-like GNAT family acetyltransferase